jgi:hypothetical protein
VLVDFGRKLDLPPAPSLRLVDRWQGLDVAISASEPAGFWAFPITSVSRSQRGLESIQQSVAVMPHWMAVGDAAGRFAVELRLSIVTASSGVHEALGPHDWMPGSSQKTAPHGMNYVVDPPHGVLGPKSHGASKARRNQGR